VLIHFYSHLTIIIIIIIIIHYNRVYAYNHLTAATITTTNYSERAVFFFSHFFYQPCKTHTQTHTKDKITRTTFKLRYCVTCLYRTRLLYSYLRENNDISQVYLLRTLESWPLVYDYMRFLLYIYIHI
jgi:hypothetical protein